MAIKKFRFSFDVPLTALLGLVATGHGDIQIDVMGDNERPAQLPDKEARALLGPPKQKRRRRSGKGTANGESVSVISIILRELASRPGLKSRDFYEPITQAGLNKRSYSPQMLTARQQGWVKKNGDGSHKLTAKGAKECEVRGITIANGADHAEG